MGPVYFNHISDICLSSSANFSQPNCSRVTEINLGIEAGPTAEGQPVPPAALRGVPESRVAWPKPRGRWPFSLSPEMAWAALE